ncbi:hypothetical protein AMS68_004193 [Peltaster fructicola]|uniref:Uncharacterized protein n=1 Tax=Peltaster fructicola TaxID=286661 RepID=A0A6H0XVG0_9PEZI|nr:hypothetical protein AMS68_004193 [Peltaster fructicola]
MTDDIVPDDDIAAQMGFSSFGSQPKQKKRRLEAAPARSQPVVPTIDKSVPAKQTASADTRNTTSAEPDLRAFRYGVRNERGDMTFFMPSFIEDPWKDLRKSMHAQSSNQKV